MIDWGTVETPDLARTTNVPALPRGTAAGPAARTTVTIWERRIREDFNELKERYPIPRKEWQGTIALLTFRVVNGEGMKA